MPEVQGKKFPYSDMGKTLAKKARERVMTSDGMMLGRKIGDLRKKLRPGVMKPMAGAKDMIKAAVKLPKPPQRSL